MKELTDQLNRVPKIGFVIGASLVAVLLSIPIVMFLILPGLDELNKLNLEIDIQKQKAEEIKKTIALLNSESKSKLSDYSRFFDQLIPGELDMLHFASLNEVVAAAIGAEINTISISKGVVPNQTTAPPAGTTATTAPVQTAPTKVTVTYRSSFDVMLDLINSWKEADQLVGVSLIKATSDSSGVLNYTIEYSLPVSAAVAKATIGEKIQFTEAEKDQIDDIKSKIIYFATPSAQPLGKNNPFK